MNPAPSSAAVPASAPASASSLRHLPFQRDVEPAPAPSALPLVLLLVLVLGLFWVWARKRKGGAVLPPFLARLATPTSGGTPPVVQRVHLANGAWLVVATLKEGRVAVLVDRAGKAEPVNLEALPGAEPALPPAGQGGE